MLRITVRSFRGCRRSARAPAEWRSRTIRAKSGFQSGSRLRHGLGRGPYSPRHCRSYALLTRAGQLEVRMRAARSLGRARDRRRPAGIRYRTVSISTCGKHDNSHSTNVEKSEPVSVNIDSPGGIYRDVTPRGRPICFLILQAKIFMAWLLRGHLPARLEGWGTPRTAMRSLAISKNASANLPHGTNNALGVCLRIRRNLDRKDFRTACSIF